MIHGNLSCALFCILNRVSGAISFSLSPIPSAFVFAFVTDELILHFLPKLL